MTLLLAPDQLPEEFRTQIINYKAKTEEIHLRLESGEDMNLAQLEERGTRLSIK